MWFLLPIAAAAVGLAFLYESVSEDEKKASETWRKKNSELKKTIQDHEKTIQTYLKNRNNYLVYTEMIDFHYSSVQVSNVAYQLLNDSKITLKGLNELITRTNAHRRKLQAEIDIAKSNKDKKELYEKIEEIKVVNMLRKQQFEERDSIKNQTEEFYNKLKDLNNQTSDIKFKIRDHCGQQGKDWFKRLEERKRKT